MIYLFSSVVLSPEWSVTDHVGGVRLVRQSSPYLSLGRLVSEVSRTNSTVTSPPPSYIIMNYIQLGGHTHPPPSHSRCQGFIIHFPKCGDILQSWVCPGTWYTVACSRLPGGIVESFCLHQTDWSQHIDHITTNSIQTDRISNTPLSNWLIFQRVEAVLHRQSQ